MAALACPGAASALGKADRACLGRQCDQNGRSGMLRFWSVCSKRLSEPASVPPVRSKRLFERAVRDRCSQKLVSVALCSEPLHSALLCSVHGYARGHTIYTSVDPCIYMHEARQSRVQWLRAQCSRAQHFRIAISNSSLESLFERTGSTEAGSNSLFERTGGTGQARTAFSSAFLSPFAPFCAFLSLFEPS